jgi:hypothetical protein
MFILPKCVFNLIWLTVNHSHALITNLKLCRTSSFNFGRVDYPSERSLFDAFANYVAQFLMRILHHNAQRSQLYYVYNIDLRVLAIRV